MDGMMSMSTAGVRIYDRDTSADLLRTIAEVLDIRSVFPRVSEIVNQVLAHDALELVFHDRSGHVTLEARSAGDLTGAFGCSVTSDEPFYIVSDLRNRVRLPGGTPPAIDRCSMCAASRATRSCVSASCRKRKGRIGPTM